jgi:hypothetical protein
MNERLVRMLLALYPRRIRDRYGAELIDLHRELEPHDVAGRARLIADVLVGALAARSARERARLATGLAVAAAAVAFGVVALAGHAADTAAPRLALVGVPVDGHTCFVDGAATCSLEACSQFIAGASVTDAVLDLSAPTDVRRRGQTPRCTAYPRTRPRARVFADGGTSDVPATPVRVTPAEPRRSR